MQEPVFVFHSSGLFQRTSSRNRLWNFLQFHEQLARWNLVKFANIFWNCAGMQCSKCFVVFQRRSTIFELRVALKTLSAARVIIAIDLLQHFIYLCGRFLKFYTKLHACPLFQLKIRFHIAKQHNHTSTKLLLIHVTVLTAWWHMAYRCTSTYKPAIQSHKTLSNIDVEYKGSPVSFWCHHVYILLRYGAPEGVYLLYQNFLFYEKFWT